MTETELINSFIAWSKLKDNIKPSYDYLLKEKHLLEWNQKYFNNKLFLIDSNKIIESINDIERTINDKSDEWRKFSKSKKNQAPEAILGNENYLKFLKQNFQQELDEAHFREAENAIYERDINFFSTNTNVASLDQNAPDGIEEFIFEGIYTLKDKIKKGSIIFFTQHGERPAWHPGLSGICMVTQEPYDVGYHSDPKKIKYFRIKMTPLIILPKVLNRSDFMGYFDCYDATFIGPTTKGEPNQAISLITAEKVRHVIGVLIQTFPELQKRLEMLFGKDFPIITRRAVVPVGINTQNPQSLKVNIPKIGKPNVINDFVPRNLIVYGAPGTGKSYRLKVIAEGDGQQAGLFPEEWLRNRITFHPNYSYRNFVGSYKPKPLYKDSTEIIYSSDSLTVNKLHQKEPVIEYQFEPGPFLEMLVRAFTYPDYNFVIIIEEINRANTAAVFGDVFQLLDRNDRGESEYSITLEPSAQDYLKVNGIHTTSIKIPPNLYLWATMNSADQGVMPLDSAFKRRWSFEHLGLNDNMEHLENLYIKLPFLIKDNKRLKWNAFRHTINQKLMAEGIHEDKLIGPFFLNKFEIDDPISVKNKLLLYLKEDVLRYKSCLFKEDLKSFSAISEAFIKEDNIFSRELEFAIEVIQNTADIEVNTKEESTSKLNEDEKQ